MLLHALTRPEEVTAGEVRTPQGQVTVSTMAQEPHLVREPLEGPRVELDRLPVAAEVGGAAADPDQRVGIVGIPVEIGLAPVKPAWVGCEWA